MVRKPSKTLLKIKRVHVPCIGSVSTIHGRFTATLDVDLTWPTESEDRSKWDPNSPEAYTPNFEPRIVAMNGISVIVENVKLSHGSPYKVLGEGEDAINYMRCRFSGEFAEVFDLANFPCDVQSLSVTFAIDFWCADQLEFELCDAQPYIMSVPTRYASLKPAWIPLRAHCFALTEDKKHDPKKQPWGAPWANGDEIDQSRLICKVQVKRNCTSYLVRIGLPCLGLNVLLLSIFACDEPHDSVAVALAIVLSYVALIFTLSNLIPMAGHVSIADRYVLLSMMLSILGLGMSVLASSVGNGGGDDDGGACADCIAASVLVALQVLMHSYLAMCARNAVRKENCKLLMSREKFKKECRSTAKKMHTLWTTYPIPNDPAEEEKKMISFSRFGLVAGYRLHHVEQ